MFFTDLAVHNLFVAVLVFVMTSALFALRALGLLLITETITRVFGFLPDLFAAVVIVAVGVSNQPPDAEHLEPMLQRIASAAGDLPDVMTLDAGYWSEDNATACSDQGVDAYIATGRLPHGKLPPPQRGPLPRDADARTRMARKVRSKKGSRIYAQRKAIVEPVNGQIKEARGLRRFLLRGLEKVNGEWHLIAATHNLLKLFRYRRSQQQALAAATG